MDGITWYFWVTRCALRLLRKWQCYWLPVVLLGGTLLVVLRCANGDAALYANGSATGGVTLTSCFRDFVASAILLLP